MSASLLCQDVAPSWSNLNVLSLTTAEPGDNVFNDLDVEGSLTFSNTDISGYTATALSYYQEEILLGNWSGAIANVCEIAVTRVGRNVSMSVLGSASGTHATGTIDFSIPAMFRPPATLIGVCSVINNGTAALGVYSLGTTLVIGVPGSTYTPNAFSPGTGRVYPFSLSFSIEAPL